MDGVGSFMLETVNVIARARNCLEDFCANQPSLATSRTNDADLGAGRPDNMHPRNDQPTYLPARVENKLPPRTLKDEYNLLKILRHILPDRPNRDVLWENSHRLHQSEAAAASSEPAELEERRELAAVKLLKAMLKADHPLHDSVEGLI
ncbi:hypothetical protein Bbelb_306680 [Branchiostoma belcheri]|nr:hypothetical protein Bbelb_306680 [Branchiostoma belcheri]